MIRALLLALGLVAAGPAAATCRQALAFGLDVSGSVDAIEYRQQIGGLAGALGAEEVVARLLEDPTSHVRIAIYEWSGRESQRVLVPWTEITDRAALDAVRARLLATGRLEGDPSTAIGSAILAGAALLSEQRSCWRRTLDLSGDGKNNTGPRPQDIGEAAAAGLTINALVIGNYDDVRGESSRQARVAELIAYFRAWVIRGPDAFTEVALDFEEYEPAMIRKILKELQSIAIGRLETGGGRPG